MGYKIPALAFGLIRDAVACCGVWEGGLSGWISSGGLSHASCQSCCMLGRRAAGTESMCSKLSLSVDVARPASGAFTDSTWETSPRRMVWCEV